MTFEEFQEMLYQHSFDIIKLSETWSRNNRNLLQYVQMPGYNFCYRNQDKRRGGGVGLYTKGTIKYKERGDLNKLNETIGHMWTEFQGKNKNKKYLFGFFTNLVLKIRENESGFKS